MITLWMSVGRLYGDGSCPKIPCKHVQILRLMGFSKVLQSLLSYPAYKGISWSQCMTKKLQGALAVPSLCRTLSFEAPLFSCRNRIPIQMTAKS